MEDNKRGHAPKVLNMVVSMSLDEIAKELGITRSRVGQIEIIALRKVKTKLAQWGYSLEDFFR